MREKNNEKQEKKIKNRDIGILLMCKPMLGEIDELRRTDVEEQKAILGAIKLDGMPHGSSRNSGLEDVVGRAEAIHKRRIQLIDAYIAKIDAAEVILQKIPPEQRSVARLLYVNQLPIWRVADIVSMSESTVKRMKSEMEKKATF